MPDMKRICMMVMMLAAMCGVSADVPDKDAKAEDEKSAAPGLAAEKMQIKCAVCRGKGSLKASPPDVGQFTGKINDRSHWDVKIKPCPICEKGRGRRIVWNLAQPEPSTEAPCMTCGWAGLVQCRKCVATGIVKCPRSDCKDGWIVTKQQGRQSYRKPPDVKLCPECRGIGKIACPECKGMRANLCKRCFGTGRKR